MQTSHASLTIDVCRCDMDVVIGMASSLGTFILSSTVFLTVGLTCGYYHMHGRRRIKQQSHIQDPTTHVYEDINVRYKQQESELTENVAYNCVNHSSM